MPKGSESKSARLRRLISERGLEYIDEAALGIVAAELAPVSATHLRRLLRDSGVPLSPLVEGVNQQSFADLERTLLALASEYGRADAFGKRAVRDMVISAKDHARFAALRAKTTEAAAAKREMALWMLTWLENPGVFAEWAAIRKRTFDVP